MRLPETFESHAINLKFNFSQETTLKLSLLLFKVREAVKHKTGQDEQRGLVNKMTPFLPSALQLQHCMSEK